MNDFLKEVRLYVICIIVVSLIIAAATIVGNFFLLGVEQGNPGLWLSALSVAALLGVILFVKVRE